MAAGRGRQLIGVAALDALVAPGGQAWVADPGRPPAPSFIAAAAAGGWTVDTVPHDGPAFVAVHRLRRA